MREIKFRAWDKVQKKMRQWDWFDHEEIGLLLSSEEEVFIPLQYTGLKDKNGKEIYEGDIIQNDSSQKFIVSWTIDICGFYQIMIPYGTNYPEFTNGVMKSFMPHMSDMRFHLKKIIGNIYQNPELLTHPAEGRNGNEK